MLNNYSFDIYYYNSVGIIINNWWRFENPTYCTVHDKSVHCFFEGFFTYINVNEKNIINVLKKPKLHKQHNRSVQFKKNPALKIKKTQKCIFTVVLFQPIYATNYNGSYSVLFFSARKNIFFLKSNLDIFKNVQNPKFKTFEINNILFIV